jgi:hypothetical protein
VKNPFLRPVKLAISPENTEKLPLIPSPHPTPMTSPQQIPLMKPSLATSPSQCTSGTQHESPAPISPSLEIVLEGMVVPTPLLPNPGGQFNTLDLETPRGTWSPHWLFWQLRLWLSCFKLGELDDMIIMEAYGRRIWRY